MVFARDDEGRMTDIGTAEMSTKGNCYYTLLERRSLDSTGNGNNTLTVSKKRIPRAFPEDPPIKRIVPSNPRRGNKS